jgi:hypothetical protein
MVYDEAATGDGATIRLRQEVGSRADARHAV